ncbi:hypothetical protein [Peribacillus butanolivorans]|uniref:hypothetical protein n=1 Tax=Peribacillus butanolivorans TaxID=421767 RepID=UPI00366A692E
MDGILYSPQGRAVSAILSTFGSGILCGAVINQITIDGKIAWSRVHLSFEFWLTVLLVILLLVYYIRMYKKDVEISAVLSDYQDKDILLAMARKEQMKELMKWSKQQAKLGNLDQLNSLDKFLKGEYKNESDRNDRQGPGKGSETGKESGF